MTSQSLSARPIQLLVKQQMMSGLAAHIPDAAGQPICKTNLKLSTWHIQTCNPQGMIVCKSCRKKQAQQARTPAPLDRAARLARLQGELAALHEEVDRAVMKAIQRRIEAQTMRKEIQRQPDNNWRLVRSVSQKI